MNTAEEWNSLPPTLLESRIDGLKKIQQGKVRDIYRVDTEHLLIVTTDRMSAFDVVLPDIRSVGYERGSDTAVSGNAGRSVVVS